MADPFDAVTALGWRIVYVLDFDYRVVIVDGGADVILVDPACDRRAAADSALDLIAAEPC